MSATHDYRITRDGAWYVVDDVSGEPVSPPMPSRGTAADLMAQIAALPASERALLRAGSRPAPRCSWLFAR
jgi:hypothetical protein